MVLAKTRSVPALILLALTAASCIEHAKSTPSDRPNVRVVIINENNADGALVASPPSLTRELETELAAQGLEAVWVDDTSFADAFRARRSTQGRLRFLGEKLGPASGDALVLLVETRSAFYSLLEGRFRWVVNVKASFVRIGSADAPVTASFDTPAILNFPHQGAADALRYVAGPIAREIRSLAARYLDERPTDTAPPEAEAPVQPAPEPAERGAEPRDTPASEADTDNETDTDTDAP